MIVTIALQKEPDTNKLVDKFISTIIKWKTKSKYFHSETIINEKWISSSPKVGAVNIHKLRPKLSDKYDYFDIKIHGARVKKMLKFAEEQVGKKYDWKGIFLSQTIDLNLDNKNKWFCSELVAHLLKIGGLDVPGLDSDYSPGDIYRLIENKSIKSELVK